MVSAVLQGRKIQDEEGKSPHKAKKRKHREVNGGVEGQKVHTGQENSDHIRTKRTKTVKDKTPKKDHIVDGRGDSGSIGSGSRGLPPPPSRRLPSSTPPAILISATPEEYEEKGKNDKENKNKKSKRNSERREKDDDAGNDGRGAEKGNPTQSELFGPFSSTSQATSALATPGDEKRDKEKRKGKEKSNSSGSKYKEKSLDDDILALDDGTPQPVSITNDSQAPTPKTNAKTKSKSKSKPKPEIHSKTTTITAPSSPFYSQTSSFYVPIPAIGQSTHLALPSVVATHLAPLLLTYYPPLRGVVLAITNPTLSSDKPDPRSRQAIPLAIDGEKDQYYTVNHNTPSRTKQKASRIVLAQCADEDGGGTGAGSTGGGGGGGLAFVWVTATFLLFRPRIGDELKGWVNVCSEGFVGLLCYNYFQVAVARDRIPKGWRWAGPGRGGGEEGKGKEKGKGRLEIRQNDDVDEEEDDEEHDDDDEEEEETEKGNPSRHSHSHAHAHSHFLRQDGTIVEGLIGFRVVDCEVVPGHDRNSWSLQVDGSLLSVNDEAKILKRERREAAARRDKEKSSPA